MTKAHLTQSADPIEPNTQKVLAMCAAIIPNPVFEFNWEPGQDMPEELSTISVCGKCLRAVIEGRERNPRHYLYGVRSGEEVKQEEAAA